MLGTQTPADGGFDARSDPVSPRYNLVGLVVRLLWSERERARAHEVGCRLLQALSGRASNVAMVGLAFAFCGCAAVVRDGFGPAPVIAFVGFVLIVLRCVIIIDIQRRFRAGSITSPKRALVPFGLTAIGSSICWGLLSFVAMTRMNDLVLAVIVMMSTVGTASSVAARNAGLPRLAKIMLAVSMTPIMVGSIFAADKGFMLLLVLLPAMTAGLFILIDESNRQLVELFEMQIMQLHLSNTDPLTNLSNRRHFDESIAAAIANATCLAQPLAILMVDVDHFKTYNDRYGHLAGDVCLRATAEILRLNLRTGDLAFRYGGEEFAIILRNTAGEAAQAIATRLCEAVAGAPIEGLAVTISVGFATTEDVDPDAAALVGAADAALYRAKDEGRNRSSRFVPSAAIERAA